LLPQRRPLLSVLPAWLAAAPLLGCGAASELYLGGGTTSAMDASDPCPSAVSGPQAIDGNCSTRDGRSRVSAPTAPHVTWTSKLPMAQLAQSSVGTDASGHAYVVSTSNLGQVPAEIRRVEAAGGTIDWTASFSGDGATGIPFILSHGGVDVFGDDPSGHAALLGFDLATGAPTSMSLGFNLFAGPPDLAVGADGSLYLAHDNGLGTPDTAAVSLFGAGD
jgi:hypothetical protein